MKRAVAAGCAFKEIGRNIGVSVEAANKMVNEQASATAVKRSKQMGGKFLLLRKYKN